MQIDWQAWIMSALSGAGGAGLAYGTIRQIVKNNTSRIDKIDVKLNDQVGGARCKEYRDDCRDNVHDRLDQIFHKLDKIEREMIGVAIKVARIEKSTE